MKLALALPAVARYLAEDARRDSALKQRLREETAGLARASMLLEADTGELLRLLVRLTGARTAIEIGTFTGYSALNMAEALPPGGRLLCCDVSEEYTAIARRYWKEAGVEDRIELKLAPARETLAALRAGGGDGTFDLAFIDADKSSGQEYYEGCLALLRPGGVIAVDNALWNGRVADPAVTDEETAALRRLNAHVLADPRVDAALLPVGDGLLLAVKHPAR